MSYPDHNHNTELQKNLHELAKQLIIAKGGDYDSLDSTTQEAKSAEILQIFFTFVEEVIESSADSKLQAQWQAYKSSNYSYQIYSDSKLLSQAMDQIITKFISL